MSAAAKEILMFEADIQITEYLIATTKDRDLRAGYVMQLATMDQYLAVLRDTTIL